MTKERTIRRKKASRSGKSQHDTEILRARRAVSAALSVESSSDPLPDGESPTPPPPMDVASDLAQAPASSSSPAGTMAVYSSLAISSDPLADLARRHIARLGKSLAGSEDPADTICREVLANLAQVRLDTVLQSPSKPTRI